ncbi:hypothetical protein [Arthrobacter sp. SD76]
MATQVLVIGAAGFLLECAAAYWFLEAQAAQPRSPMFPSRFFKPKH